MAWTAPMTAVANAIFTAAQFNTYVRDNLLETAPAKAVNAGGYMVVSGTNAIVERRGAQATVDTSESTTSATYANLTTSGPAVTVTTGVRALVILSCEALKAGGDTATSTARAAVDVSGATTIAATDAVCVCRAGPDERYQMSRVIFYDALTAGSNTFTMKYKVSSGTGTFSNRHLAVIPF